ncbi:hypothetical protein IFM89_029721 [Coptis chinensis]|uniref:Uncharacterized protein n=1 Tax=Coptis chinensis TaxID=261450 RepID=A0A835H085_9MAGN|nr:hypothetical protein IFM89_029721 [Coptis chinensis]
MEEERFSILVRVEYFQPQACGLPPLNLVCLLGKWPSALLGNITLAMSPESIQISLDFDDSARGNHSWLCKTKGGIAADETSSCVYNRPCSFSFGTDEYGEYNTRSHMEIEFRILHSPANLAVFDGQVWTQTLKAMLVKSFSEELKILILASEAPEEVAGFELNIHKTTRSGVIGKYVTPSVAQIQHLIRWSNPGFLEFVEFTTMVAIGQTIRASSLSGKAFCSSIAYARRDYMWLLVLQ